MAPVRYTAEQIIGGLRDAEVVLSKGGTVGQVYKQVGVTEQTYYRWRKEYGGSSPLITALYLTDPGSKILVAVKNLEGKLGVRFPADGAPA